METIPMTCKRCDSEMLLRDGCEPTSCCDNCAHEMAETFDILTEICEAEPVCIEIDTRSKEVEMYTKWPHDDPKGVGYIQVKGLSLETVIAEFHSLLFNR